MKQSALLRAAFLLVYVFLFGPTLVICQEHEGSIKEVLVGEVDASTMKVRFTGGTLASDIGSSSFKSYSVATNGLRDQGVAQKAINDLEGQLKQSLALLEKRDKPVTASPRGFGRAQTAEGGLVSILEVKKASMKIGYRRIYQFRVLTGGAEAVVRAVRNSGNDHCERLNDKCFICSDGSIRCVTTALASERDSWRSYPGNGDNEDE
jgi:hypothetical protein